jgi:hypothetical protein
VAHALVQLATVRVCRGKIGTILAVEVSRPHREFRFGTPFPYDIGRWDRRTPIEIGLAFRSR